VSLHLNFDSYEYRHSSKELHTSSDGKKINVVRASLNASYSFKYFGKEKGVSVYTFLDERQSLFHSTDTHGFTETIFAATHFINTAFAPRIKRIAEQTLYAFSGSKTYENRGYKILPSRTINLKLIERHWDDILRFMATIKLKHCSASILFKRLSSYAKDHPLY
jgi:TnpA family transposase